jgi:hypothetical protein
MKLLYPGILLQRLTENIPRTAFLVLLLPGLAYCQAQTSSQELVFINPQLQRGPGFPLEGQDGATYIFRNVTTDVDAQVTITGRSSPEVTLSSIDLPGPDEDSTAGVGYDKSWQPKIAFKESSAQGYPSWWMEFRISFVEHYDNANPASVEQFYVTALNIGGNLLNLREELAFYGLQSYSLEQNSMITASSIKGCLADPNCLGTVFYGPQNQGKPFCSKPTDTFVTNYYTNSNSFIVRIGAKTGDSGELASCSRLNSLWFKAFEYNILRASPDPLEQFEFTARTDEPDHQSGASKTIGLTLVDARKSRRKTEIPLVQPIYSIVPAKRQEIWASKIFFITELPRV